LELPFGISYDKKKQARLKELMVKDSDIGRSYNYAFFDRIIIIKLFRIICDGKQN